MMKFASLHWMMRFGIAVCLVLIGMGASRLLPAPTPKRAPSVSALLMIAQPEPLFPTETLRPSHEETRVLRRTIAQEIKSPRILHRVFKRPEINALELDMADPVGWLEANLQTEYPNDGNILRVSLPGANTQITEPLLKAIVAIALDDFNHRVDAETLLRVVALEKSYVEHVENLKRLRGHLAALERGISESSEGSAIQREIKRIEDFVARLSVRLETMKIERYQGTRITLYDQIRVNP